MSRGGQRAGAGRPKEPGQRMVSLTFRVPPSLREAIDLQHAALRTSMPGATLGDCVRALIEAGIASGAD